MLLLGLVAVVVFGAAGLPRLVALEPPRPVEPPAAPPAGP